MNIGIDGNMWYCSNGVCLAEPHAKYTFERTLQDAVTEYRKEFGPIDVPKELEPFLSMTPEEASGDLKSTTD